MKKRVDAHIFDSTMTPEVLTELAANLSGSLVVGLRRDARRGGASFRFVQGDACWAYSLADYALMRRCLSVSAECAAICFQASGTEGMITFSLEGIEYQGPGGPSDYQASEELWLAAFLTTLLLRRRDLVETFRRFDRRALEMARSGGDAYRFELVEALRTFDAGEPGCEVFLDRCDALMAPQHVRAPIKYVAQHRALSMMLRAITHRDQVLFTEGYEAALKAHKALFGRGQAATQCDSLLALPAMGMAALGVDHGMKLEVESGYAPEWLVLGKDAP